MVEQKNQRNTRYQKKRGSSVSPIDLSQASKPRGIASRKNISPCFNQAYTDEQFELMQEALASDSDEL